MASSATTAAGATIEIIARGSKLIDISVDEVFLKLYMALTTGRTGWK